MMNKLNLGKQNNSTDALLLAFVRILTLIIGLLSTSILSHNLDLTDYGTYATGNLIVSTSCVLTALGLVEASNYFYHKEERCREYVSTIFAIQFIIGIGCAIVLVACRGILVRYFKNEHLYGIYALLIFRPMLGNIENILLTLQTVVGKARLIAIRNTVFSMLKLVAVILTAFVFHSIRTMFIAFLLLDVLTIVYYKHSFEQAAFVLRFRDVCLDVIRPILAFSLPMGIYLLTNEVMKDIDKFVIAAYENTEQLAIYTNCSNLLPFSFVASAFLTIVLPIITKLGQSGEFQRGREVFKTYLKIGCISTVTFSAIAVVLAKELITLLYGEKYLPGFGVFIIYIFVDMLKFAGVSVVLTTFGKTKFLMVVSFASMILNVILNPVLYHFYGMPGPAIATLGITVASVIVLLNESAKLLKCRLGDLFSTKEFAVYLSEIIIVGAIMYLLKHCLFKAYIPYYFVIIVIGGLYGVAILILQGKQLVQAMKKVNHEKILRKEFNEERGNG